MFHLKTKLNNIFSKETNANQREEIDERYTIYDVIEYCSIFLVFVIFTITVVIILIQII